MCALHLASMVGATPYEYCCVLKVWFLSCKKGVFSVQKGGFYVAKTPFLFSEHITTTEQTSYTQFSTMHCIYTKWGANTPRNTHETHCETPYFDHVYTKKLLKPLGKKGFRRYFETKTAYRLRLFFIASIFS